MFLFPLFILFLIVGCKKYKIDVTEHSFESLEGCPGGATRKVHIILPPGYDESGNDEHYPTIYGLHGGGCSIDEIEKLAKIVRDKSELLYNMGQIKKMLVVIPHAATNICDGENLRYGSFYRDSDAIGNFKTFILKDLIGYVEDNYRAIRSRDKRSIGGFSMGGYGALMLAMESNVESSELGEKGKFCTASSHSGLLSLESAIVTLANMPDMEDWIMEIIECLIIQMEAAFSNGASLNLEIGSGSTDDIDPAVWAEWENNDPLTYLTRNEETALQDMVVYIDCGKSDELGFKKHAELFHEKLSELGFRHGFDIYEYPWTPEEWLNNLLSGHLFLKKRIPAMLLFHSFAF